MQALLQWHFPKAHGATMVCSCCFLHGEWPPLHSIVLETLNHVLQCSPLNTSATHPSTLAYLLIHIAVLAKKGLAIFQKLIYSVKPEYVCFKNYPGLCADSDRLIIV